MADTQTSSAWSQVKASVINVFSSFKNWMGSTKVGSKIMEWSHNIKERVTSIFIGNTVSDSEKKDTSSEYSNDYEGKSLYAMNFEQFEVFKEKNFYSKETIETYNKVKEYEKKKNTIPDTVYEQQFNGYKKEFEDAARSDIKDHINNMAFEEIMGYANDNFENNNPYRSVLNEVAVLMSEINDPNNEDKKGMLQSKLDKVEERLREGVADDIGHELYCESAEVVQKNRELPEYDESQTEASDGYECT